MGSGNDFDVRVSNKSDGRVSRLGIGHAWVWTRANGERETFDCGLAISHVLDYIAVRINCNPHEVKGYPV